MKFGGSAITRKSEFETLKRPELQKACQLIKDCVELGLKCVVVHGAGSFGHFQAKEFGLSHGWRAKPRSEEIRMKEGFCKTRLSVLKLNSFVTEELVDCGVPAVAIPACGLWCAELHSLEATGFVGHVAECIENGLVPVCHGDGIFDPTRGCTILSGDVIIQRLCSELPVERVVFLCDVSGVYSKPPNEDGAVLLPKIIAKKDGKTDVSLSTSVLHHDVSGGILAKTASCCDIVRNTEGKTAVFVCSVSSKGAFNVCTTGSLDEEEGTQILCED